MKSSKKKLPVQALKIVDLKDPDSEMILPDEEDDAVDALLHRVSRRSNFEAARYVYADAAEDDYTGQADLHRVVEELQFGHDLRL